MSATAEAQPAVAPGATIAIYSKPDHPEVGRIAPSLAAWLEERGYRVECDESTAKVLARPASPAAPDREAGLAVVLGGDGTMLFAARRLAGSSTPILAINLGTLGFLSDTPVERLHPELETVLAGGGCRQRRALLEAELLRAGQTRGRWIALNDAVIAKGAFARILHFTLDIDGETVGRYRADGLIVATPTGSTAYSLSAGGPILHPTVDVLVVTPVCPHTLNNRPLIVADSARISVSVDAPTETGFLTMDGQQGVPLERGDRVVCTKSPLTVSLVGARQRPFFELVRTKLQWG